MAVNLLPPDPAKLAAVHGVELGFAEAGIRKRGGRDVMLMRLAPGSRVAGVFTRNSFAAAPLRRGPGRGRTPEGRAPPLGEMRRGRAAAEARRCAPTRSESERCSRRLRPLPECLDRRRREKSAKPLHLRLYRVKTQRRDAEVVPPLIVVLRHRPTARLADEAFADQPPKRPIEVPRFEPNGAFGSAHHLLGQGITVPVTLGKREEEDQIDRLQGLKRGFCRHRGLRSQ